VGVFGGDGGAEEVAHVLCVCIMRGSCGWADGGGD